MDATQRSRDKLYLSLSILGLSTAIFVFHSFCIYRIWTTHGATSAGVSFVLPWVSEIYWTYYDFSWLYLGFVVIGGAMLLVRWILAETLENER